ncbi:MAG: hypothetical protein CMC82_00580 [Flavobacteriaceae bacterium]|nr:hypothetical protein [Flavobacteriaceae bacterium]
MSLPTLTPESTLSAVVLPVTGNANNINSAVPYKIYSDTTSPLYSKQFLSGALDQVSYVYKKLGGDVLDLEITEGNVYAAYEEAVLEYSYLINVHQATNILSDALGNTTGSFDSKGNIEQGDLSSSLGGTHVALKYPKFDYSMTRRVADGIGSEVGLNGSRQFSASFNITAGVQDYDLQKIISAKSSVQASGSITITNFNNLSAGDKIVFHLTSGPAIAITASSDTTTDSNTRSPTFKIETSNDITAFNLAKCISGHHLLSATASAAVVTITQKTAGANGNGTIELTDSGDAGMSKTDFVGGTTSYTGDISGKRILIKKVFYKTPHAMWRFYGYYGGLNVVGNFHNYGQFSDDSTFQLIPAWHNKSQAMAFEDAIYTRMSHFSYELKDNKIRLFPIPQTIMQDKMYVEFSVQEDIWQNDDKATDGVNNMNTLPIGNLPFNNINSIGKQWIRRFALALSKETLGQVRSKFGTVPVPGQNVNLNGSALLSEAKTEQNALRDELKTTLAELTYAKLAEQDATMSDNVEKVLDKVPNYIFVG